MEELAATVFPNGSTDFVAGIREWTDRLGYLTLESAVGPCEPEFGHLRRPLHPRLAARLRELRFDPLFRHQSQAVDAALSGQDVLVTTGTSSGKTLCYAIPAFEAYLTEPRARSLLLFPSKALAQDQLRKLQTLGPGSEIHIAAYDGDTPKSRRSVIRKNAHLLLSNPDMLHLGILPSHELWGPFLRSLRYIVLDELHVYRGVFGSHVAGVLRRLLRLAEWYGARPRIIACSATIGNPVELFEQLTARSPAHIVGDGSPQGPRTLMVVNPSAHSPGAAAAGIGANRIAAELTATLIRSGARTLTFCRSRAATEVLTRRTRELLGKSRRAVEAYRSGYTPKQRRDIEGRFFGGALRGLVATSAMEIGIDIGDLDAVVLNGYPGTLTSFRQQIGRAGRGRRPGLAVYVAHEDPLEQFVAREASRLSREMAEAAIVHPDNPRILRSQLLCAAYERPLDPGELSGFGPAATRVAEEMVEGGELSPGVGRLYYPSHRSPASNVSIRGVSRHSVSLRVEGSEIGTMESWRAATCALAGAIYLHQGSDYEVTRCDLEAGVVEMIPTESEVFTTPKIASLVEPLAVLATSASGSLIHAGITQLALGYQSRQFVSDALISETEYAGSPITYETMAVRLDVPDTDAEADAVHGLEHALRAVAPILAGCDRGDLGSAWAMSFGQACPAVFLFDAIPGGVGLSEALFSRMPEWTLAARRLLDGCPCTEGCPACLLRAGCEVGNMGLSKAGAAALLEALGGSVGENSAIFRQGP